MHMYVINTIPMYINGPFDPFLQLVRKRSTDTTKTVTMKSESDLSITLFNVVYYYKLC